jgi:transaldolase/glucose-6-phosphate isomerase
MLGRMPEITAFSEWVQDLGFSRVVLLGMGGSSLAPDVFQRVIGPAPGNPSLTVLDTTDPAAILALENSIDIESTLFIVSSKSGTTIETASLQAYFAERMRDASGETGSFDNFVAITDPGTPLHQQAIDDGYRRVFLNPPDIGGRYSALSFFGLIPAAAIGVDVERILQGVDSLDFEIAVELGMDLAGHASAGRDKLTLLAEPQIESLGAWIEQLIAESTGKRGTGIIPVDREPLGDPAAYSNDRAFVDLGGGLSPAGHVSLETSGHPVVDLGAGDLYSIGREFLRWEIATAAAGAALGINPFDEPNVKESKDNTAAILDEFRRSGRSPDRESGVLIADGPDAVGLVAAHLGAVEPGQYAAVMAYIRPGPDHDALLGRLRVAVRDSSVCATTVGYGPRFLHSTGQLHKGGPPSGVFLQITADDAVDIEIPGRGGLTFGQLKAAQALGDLRALASRRLPTARVHLRGDVTSALGDLVAAVEERVARPPARTGG